MLTNQRLVEDNMGLVYFIINKYYPTFITDEDIIQTGMVGLCRAAIAYDETKGVTFASFASRCILNEICNEFDRRKRQSGVVSLETRRFSEDGDGKTVGDFLIGDEDVDWFDYGKFYDKLLPQDKELVELRQLGLSGKEIAELKGCSPQRINKRLRRLRHKWRKLYGD